jgi:ankyrin repeat protein
MYNIRMLMVVVVPSNNQGANNIQFARQLIVAGSSVNIQSGAYRETPLHIAAMVCSSLANVQRVHN